MQQSIADGWDEFERGHDGEARRIFENLVKDGRQVDEALLGLARIDFRNGDLDRAAARVQQGLAIRVSDELTILAAQILGERGQRPNAEAQLRSVVSSNPDDAFARALYAEQIIRQGRWEDGTNQFIAALSSDPQGRAFEHFRKVTADLVDALIAGRMPEKTAMQFINRVAYSISTPTQEMNFFFGEARRAVTGRQALNRKPSSGGAPSGAQERLSRPDLSPQAHAPEPVRTPPSQAQPRATQARPTRQRQVPAQPTPARPARSARPPNVDANIKNVRELILEEKRLNQDLLGGIPAPDPLQWPSEMGYSTIDTVPAIALGRDSLLGVSSQIDTRDFRVSTGSLDSEIFLERCLRNLIVASQEDKAVALDARPDSVWQMEMNCRDGLLERVQPPSTLYEELEGFENYAAYSLAMFLGHALATTHDATWTFGTPASESFLELGETVLKPFELVERWINDEDKESVNLDLLSRLARRATARSTSMGTRRDYIDPTRGVHPDSLPATLTTLWTSYLFSLPDAAFSTVTESMHIDHIADGSIRFTLPRKWAPAYAAGPGDAAIRDGDRISLAYIRHTGEFVALATRKGFAAYLEATSTELDAETARLALMLLAKSHRPQWHIASDKSTANALNQRVPQTISAPHLQTGRGFVSLEVHAVAPHGVVRWELRYAPAELFPWQLNLRS